MSGNGQLTADSGPSLAQKVRAETAAVRFRHRTFGVRKALRRDQTAEAAETFHADGAFLTARKKLLDTRQPAYLAVTRAILAAKQFWRSLTVPYPEKGIRLIRKDLVQLFESKMAGCAQDLAAALGRLDAEYQQLREAARERLGDLFAAADYPASLHNEFGIAWEYPNIEPPDYLKELNPALWEAERARIAARFDDAVRMAEEAFTAEFGELVAHLGDKLAGQTDGKKKVFRNSAVENLREFVQRFRDLSMGGNAQLEQLVGQAEQLIAGVDPARLRKDGDLRTKIGGELAGIEQALGGLMVDRPARAIDLSDEE